MIAYEVHTLRDHKWRIVAIYDDLEIAKHEARITAELGFDQGVLVIEENYNPDTNKATWRTRFRTGKFAKRVWGNLASMRRVARRSDTKHRQRQRDRQRDGLPVDERAFRPKMLGPYARMFVITVIVFCGLAAIYGIRYVAALAGD
jgi:hypothetical protein